MENRLHQLGQAQAPLEAAVGGLEAAFDGMVAAS